MAVFGRGKLKLALKLLDKLLKDNYPVVSYTILIEAKMIEDGINEATKLPNEMLERGLELDTYVYNSIIREICKEGLAEKAFPFIRNWTSKGYSR